MLSRPVTVMAPRGPSGSPRSASSPSRRPAHVSFNGSGMPPIRPPPVTGGPRAAGRGVLQRAGVEAGGGGDSVKRLEIGNLRKLEGPVLMHVLEVIGARARVSFHFLPGFFQLPESTTPLSRLRR